MSRYRDPIMLIPKFFSHWWWHPSLDRRFIVKLHPESFFGSSIFDKRSPLEKLMSESFFRPWSQFLREHENNGRNTFVMKNDKGKFHISLDVQEFKPNEINVKIVDNFVVVEGKHEEREEDYELVSRHFVRKYVIPEQCDPDKVTSTLSSNGVLTITVPKKPEAVEDKKERIINVEYIKKAAVEDEPETNRATETNRNQ